MAIIPDHGLFGGIRKLYKCCGQSQRRSWTSLATVKIHGIWAKNTRVLIIHRLFLKVRKCGVRVVYPERVTYVQIVQECNKGWWWGNHCYTIWWASNSQCMHLHALLSSQRRLEWTFHGSSRCQLTWDANRKKRLELVLQHQHNLLWSAGEMRKTSQEVLPQKEK